MELSWMADYTLPAVLSPSTHGTQGFDQCTPLTPTVAPCRLVTGGISIHSGWGWYSEEVSRGRVFTPRIDNTCLSQNGKIRAWLCTSDLRFNLWLAYGCPIKLSVPMLSLSWEFIHFCCVLAVAASSSETRTGKCCVQKNTQDWPQLYSSQCQKKF